MPPVCFLLTKETHRLGSQLGIRSFLALRFPAVFQVRLFFLQVSRLCAAIHPDCGFQKMIQLAGLVFHHHQASRPLSLKRPVSRPWYRPAVSLAFALLIVTM